MCLYNTRVPDHQIASDENTYGYADIICYESMMRLLCHDRNVN